MKKRQIKKNWNKFINGTQRYGCEYCCSISAIFFKDEKGWFDVSLGYERKKIFLRQDHEKVGWIDASYCWNCGRKLKK